MLFDAALVAFQTLTRLPVPSPREAPDDRTLGLSAVFFPLAGFVVGGLGWAVWVGTAGALGVALAAGLVWTALTLVTGCLHEDGLADTADAFGSQYTAADRLRVMKDSRIGVYGAVALVLLYGLRWQALAQSLVPGPALVVAMTVARAMSVGLAAWSGPAASGMGGGFARGVTPGHWVAALLVAAALLLPWMTTRLAVAAALCVMALALAVPYFRRRIGGVTGDSLGAFTVVCELLVLTVYAAR